MGLLALALTAGCADDPFDFDSPRSCDPTDENEWVYGVMSEVYLFADELQAIDPADYPSPAEMVRAVRVEPDRWSRVSDKSTTEALFQEGAYIGLGYSTRRDAAGDLVVSFVTEDSPAGQAGLRRGDRIAAIGGLQIAQIEAEDRWSEVLGEDVPGVRVELTVDDGVGESTVMLEKEWIGIATVPIHEILTVADRPVGYVMFSSFLEPAHDELDAAFERIAASGASEVIVDLRYNGGGLLSVAQHLIGLLVGDVADGKTAYRVEYNDKFSDEDADRKLAHHAGSIPNVDHVVFITTGSTLSASELVINAVRPYVQVSVIGGTTGGKPVGSRHFEFCDKVLAPITFQVVNSEGFGDYFTGLPADCTVADDLMTPLGDPQESSLAAALTRLETGACPEAPAADGVEAAVGFSPGLAARPTAAPLQVLPPRPGAPDELRGVW